MVIAPIAAADGPDALQTAARIWAAATARREGLAEPMPAQSKIPGLRAALDNPGASLHLATADGTSVGFVVLVPSGSAIEVRYLAVSPQAWGDGIATRLLDYLGAHARDLGYHAAELWVLEDNKRAIEVYLRAGWMLSEAVKCQVDTRRIEVRLELSLR